MAVRRIYIQDRNKNNIKTISGSMLMRAAESAVGMGVEIAVDQSTREITLSSPGYFDMYQMAYESFTVTQMITSINGVTPTDDGNFFILDSECMSWRYGNSQSDTEPANGLITIIDLCPTCTSCDEALLLKKQVEFYKMLYNAIKDAQLYYDDVAKLRMQYLAANRLPMPANCAEAVASLDPKYLESPEVKGLSLFQQYATVVHMWNYVVSQNNASIEIRNTPEDAAGFYVQTKRALPSCNRQSTIKCTIEVRLVSGQAGLSMYVHDPKTEFKPFKNEGGVTENQAVVAHLGFTEKRVETTFNPASCAGTYCLTVKFLPFIYSFMLDRYGNQINIRDFAWSILTGSGPVPGGENTEFENTTYYLGADYSTAQIMEPTAKNYNDAKTYPSKSVEARNIWEVRITWQLSGSMDKTFVDTYYYECNGVREYMDGIMKNSDLISIAAGSGL